MSANTKIEWADHTFNPWIGCTKVGPGCDNCYAKADFDDRKHRVTWGAGQPRSRTKTWGDPVKWNKQPYYECTCCGWRGDAADPEFSHPSKGCIHDLVPTRARVFCASLADVFDNEVDPMWRADLFELIRETPNLHWLLLTKRIGNVLKMLPSNTSNGPAEMFAEHYPNAWIGATICTQEEADRDIPKLLAVPAAKRFLSMEPLLGPVSFEGMWVPHTNPAWHENMLEALDWVIVGGESGPNARPMHPDWVRSLRDQCQAAGVPFLFKQWGEFLPTIAAAGDPCVPDVPESKLFWSDGEKWDRFDGQRGGVDLVARVGKKAAGRLLDGREWNGVPQ